MLRQEALCLLTMVSGEKTTPADVSIMIDLDAVDGVSDPPERPREPPAPFYRRTGRSVPPLILQCSIAALAKLSSGFKLRNLCLYAGLCGQGRRSAELVATQQRRAAEADRGLADRGKSRQTARTFGKRRAPAILPRGPRPSRSYEEMV